MEIVLNTVSCLFVLFGGGIWLAAVKSKSASHFWGGFLYICSGLVSIIFNIWAPLAVGFALSFVVRKTLGDPHKASSKTSRSIEYNQLSKILVNSYLDDSFDSEIREIRVAAEARLISLIKNDPEIKIVFDGGKIDIDRLKNIYETIIYAGFGQAVNNEWVPAASIATPYTLSYLLHELSEYELPAKYPSKEVQIIIWNVFNYFKCGDPLP